MPVRYPRANVWAATFSRTCFSLSSRSRSCAKRCSFSSILRFSAASMRCVATSSALRICSKCSWCARMAASSSSSITSISPCSSVLPTSTSRIGSTSKSKSKRSPASICVSASTPIFIGMKRGVGGRSMKGSVCVFTSRSGTVSVSSSRKESVWTSMWRLPSTAFGVGGGLGAVFLLFEVSKLPAAGGAAGRICAAYVLPRITLRSNMMFAG
mmetsp:Transcript_14419/g.24425  ORF Transcript_14419/g.24425 Transcript_14419/m.24425 type:complete len:212 (-) Transcript_14419:304-939(-)